MFRGAIKCGFLLSPLLLVSAAPAAEKLEQPVGVILSGTKSQLIRAGTETPLSAKPGELLFAGDGLETTGAAASFVFCPAKVIRTLLPDSYVQLETSRSSVRRGRISEQPTRSCFLPQAVRLTNASQQHYAVAMTRGTPGQYPPVPRDQLPAALLAELAPIERALERDANDSAALIEAANLFEINKVYANALDMYFKLRAQWPDAVWLKSKIFELETILAQQSAAARRNATRAGKTYALLVGISTYAKPALNLQFAHKDATDFASLLQTPPVGPVDKGDILLLTDQDATTAAIRVGFEDFLRNRASKSDTVVILLAGHGTVDTKGEKLPYLVTYDSDPENFKDTAIGIAELQNLFREQLKNVGRVVIFVDVCNAGAVGIDRGKNINQFIESQIGGAPGALFGVLAAGPNEASVEGPKYGGGHGVFTYFVMQGMNGDADADKNKIVGARELFTYVYNNVSKATTGDQNPREFGRFENQYQIADLNKLAAPVAQFRTLRDARSGDPLLLAAAGQVSLNNEAQRNVDIFTAAVREGRLLPDTPSNAVAALATLKRTLDADTYFRYENQLRIALEDRAQKILLQYLSGDQRAQPQIEFNLGAKYMAAARLITRESLYLEGREAFFNGRALLFDRKFPEAMALLENAVRISPATGYAYNALGIGYLEQGVFDNAARAFRDASRRAPYWAYPLHNLALTYSQLGDYAAAIRAYRQAMQLAPRYPYLAYNLGLLYQRINKLKDAETSFRHAIELDPRLADTYNAFGFLRESQGRVKDAEPLYKQALDLNPGLLAARQNLAVMISTQPNRGAEAIALWRLNLGKNSGFVASRLSLAKALAAAGQLSEAAVEYRTILETQRDYVSARLALAGIYEQQKDYVSAVAEVRSALSTQPDSAVLLERLGDLSLAGSNPGAAVEAYGRVLDLKIDRTTRKRVRSKRDRIHP